MSDIIKIKKYTLCPIYDKDTYINSIFCKCDCIHHSKQITHKNSNYAYCNILKAVKELEELVD